jgi:hypothetical protein
MDSYNSLLSRIKLVRRRWRSQVLVKGISLFLASAIALLVLGVWGADLFGFRPGAVWGMRLSTGGIVMFVAWYFLYMPLRARLSDLQIAQYIEERYPQLEDRLVAAVEYGKGETASSGLIDLLIRDALDKTSRVDFSVFLKRKRLAYFGLLGVSAFFALFALLSWGPSFFPYGFNQLYVPWTEASFRSSMMIKVLPGDLEISKGSDQQVEAQLVGFDSPEVQLYVQPEGFRAWNASIMEPNPRGSSFRYLLLDIQSSLRYYVESKGVRSRICSIRVLDLAKVEKIGLTYTFPAYTGMASQSVENEGDISALKGTRIALRIHLSRPAQSARLLFDNQSTLNLLRAGEEDFTGNFPLQRSGSYIVQISDSRGKKYKGSSEYEMEALDDAPPKVTITRPMRDVQATNVEEVFSEVKAEDDIGIGKLELHYSVNGDPEKIAGLYSGRPPDKSVTGAHTFYLEEFGLQPGDVVSYYGKAWDNNNVTGPGISDSDIYFIEVRPFEKKYKQNQSGQGEGQGGEGQEVLSRRQKEIISATFKLIREKERMDSKEFRDGLKALSLVQGRLQADTQGLVDRFQRRGAEQLDENFRKISEYMKVAIGEMGKAAVDLGAEKPDSAMPSEQKSLQQLMRAESLFREIQVSFAAQNSGSSSQVNAQDLADLFELELNKLKNQYETVQRGEQQQRDQKVDEALQRLKELAQRQQQLNDRNRMLSQQAQAGSSSGSGGQGQEQLMREAEQLRRQLQRLSRERSSPELNEAGNRLQKALEQMQQALKASQQGKASEANAQGLRALQQLEDAQRKLARGQQSGLKEGIEQANEESRKLVEEQNRIQQELDRLARDKQSGSSAENKERKEDLISRKSNLSDRLKNLEAQIKELSRQARKTQKEAGNKLADAAGTIRDKRLPERIMGGNSLIQNGYYEYQKQSEEFIREGLEEVNKQLESAGNSLGQSREDRLEEAANRARQLSEGLESMRQRLNQNRPGLQQNQQGQQGQQGQSEQQGNQQQAQAGRAGQPGRTQGKPDEQGKPGEAQQNPSGGRWNPQADLRGPTGDASGPPTGIGRYKDEDVRQLRGELEQRLTDARELRRLLDRNSTETENLDKVIESLRRAGDYQDYRNPDQIAKLKQAIDYMRQVEYDLARDLDRMSRKDRYFFSEDNEAPAAYQKLVEEYYKAIAKSK